MSQIRPAQSKRATLWGTKHADEAPSNVQFKQSSRQIVPLGKGSGPGQKPAFAQDLGGLTKALASLEPLPPPRYRKQSTEIEPMADNLAKTDGGLVTAAILVIGDEILSGRTKDK